MAELILHHFDASPFAEKVRLALGLKQLAWHSVQIPMVMPKPLLTALTGGYRKTPVLQIGADVYCDTQRIAAELERRYPEPSLFPDGSCGLSLALSNWSDAAFFRPGAALSMGTNEGIPGEVLQDREAFFGFLDFSRLREDLPHFFAQYRAQLLLIEDMLGDGRDFLLGDQPGWADILAYFPLWMGRGNIAATSEMAAGLTRLAAWESRVTALGYGEPSPLPAEDAVTLARDSEPASEQLIEPEPWLADIAAGDTVTVTPSDYGEVPVRGRLHRLTGEDVAVRISPDDVGDLVVHFPRIGYEVKRV